ncbi:hypothetical protein ACFRCQ_18105 [Cytobacillus firmus]|uniref:hypothetical protein n=1 Tax=Cytobacillus firmus TaxID=1399 RepID=UPI0036BF2FC9
MTKKINKTEKLDEVLKRCKDDTGIMYKIPVLSSLREVDGEMICEVESYKSINDGTFLNKDNSFIH